MLEAAAELGVVIALATGFALLSRWIIDGICERIWGRNQ